MEDKNNIENELGATAPFLSKMEKTNKFDVPANYFEEFPMKVADKIHAHHAQKESWAAKYFRPVLIPTFATLIIAIGIGLYLHTSKTQNNTAVSVPAVNTTHENLSITDYVDEDVLIDTYKKDLVASKHSLKIKEQDTLVNIIIDQTDLSDLNDEL